MHIVTKDVTKLTPVEYYSCRRANFGRDGCMQTEVTHARNNEPGYEGSKAIMIWKDHNHDSGAKLIAWCLLTPSKADGLIYASPYQRRACKYAAEFWVKTRYRRQGYGTMLMQHVKRHYETMPIVIPHDEASGELFSKFKVRLSDDEGREYLKRKPKMA